MSNTHESAGFGMPTPLTAAFRDPAFASDPPYALAGHATARAEGSRTAQGRSGDRHRDGSRSRFDGTPPVQGIDDFRGAHASSHLAKILGHSPRRSVSPVLMNEDEATSYKLATTNKYQ